MPQRLRKIIILNLRWHRRIGLSILVFVIFLAVTGLLLNHSPGIGLSQKNLRSSWLLHWYGFETQALSGYKLNQNLQQDIWLSHPGGHQLFLNANPVAECMPPLLSVDQISADQTNDKQTNTSEMPPLLLALCQDELVILTVTGELVEKINSVNGLPKNTIAINVSGKETLLITEDSTLALNLDTLAIQPTDTRVKNSKHPIPLPSKLVEQLNEKAELPGITLETLILDLHSGRFFGAVGILVVDLIGLLICVLALTGLWSWYSHQKLRKLGG